MDANRTHNRRPEGDTVKTKLIIVLLAASLAALLVGGFSWGLGEDFGISNFGW